MESQTLRIVTIVQIVAIIVVLWLIFSMPRPWDLQRDIGTALVVIGIAGIALARYQLGRSFSITAKAKQLVTKGIYSKIRNPIYVFGTLVFAGFVLVLHRPILWLLVVAVAIMQVMRARREARVLEAAFGDAYREYRRKTWF